MFAKLTILGKFCWGQTPPHFWGWAGPAMEEAATEDPQPATKPTDEQDKAARKAEALRKREEAMRKKKELMEKGTWFGNRRKSVAGVARRMSLTRSSPLGGPATNLFVEESEAKPPPEPEQPEKPIGFLYKKTAFMRNSKADGAAAASTAPPAQKARPNLSLIHI